MDPSGSSHGMGETIMYKIKGVLLGIIAVIIFCLLLYLLTIPFIAHGEEYPQDELKWNPYNDQWTYERPDSELRLNVLEDNVEYAEPEEELRYNPIEDRYEYAR